MIRYEKDFEHGYNFHFNIKSGSLYQQEILSFIKHTCAIICINVGCSLIHGYILHFICIATTRINSANHVICNTNLFLVLLLPFISLNTYLCSSSQFFPSADLRYASRTPHLSPPSLVSHSPTLILPV